LICSNWIVAHAGFWAQNAEEAKTAALKAAAAADEIAEEAAAAASTYKLIASFSVVKPIKGGNKYTFYFDKKDIGTYNIKQLNAITDGKLSSVLYKRNPFMGRFRKRSFILLQWMKEKLRSDWKHCTSADDVEAEIHELIKSLNFMEIAKQFRPNVKLCSVVNRQ